MANVKIFDVVYAPLVVETALAIFEDLYDKANTLGSTVEQWRDDNGSSALRHAAMFMAPTVHEVWEGLDEDTKDCLTWDWDFVPAMVELFAWDTTGGYGEFPSIPTMRGAAYARYGQAMPDTHPPDFMIPLAPGIWDCE